MEGYDGVRSSVLFMRAIPGSCKPCNRMRSVGVTATSRSGCNWTSATQAFTKSRVTYPHSCHGADSTSLQGLYREIGTLEKVGDFWSRNLLVGKFGGCYEHGEYLILQNSIKN